MKKKITAKKAISIISLIILCATVLLFSLVIAARAKGETPDVFGYSFHIVVTDSMTPVINRGDMVIARKKDVGDIARGDDILFTSPDPELQGITIVHRVIDINPDGSFVTQGVKAGAPVDDYPVYEIKGKAVSVSPFLGKIFSGMVDNRNIVFGAALLVLLIIIVDEIIRISLEIYRRKLKKGTTEKQEPSDAAEDKKDQSQDNNDK